MKKKILSILLIGIAIAIVIVIIIVLFGSKINKITLESLKNNKEVSVYVDNETGIPTLIAGRYTDYKITKGSSAIKALEEVKDLMNIKNPKKEFKISDETEIYNKKIYRMQQYYNDIEVEDRQLIIATDEKGNIKTLSGSYYKIENLDTKPSISEKDLLSELNKLYGNNIKIEESTLIIKVIENKAVLCWGILATGTFKNLEENSYYIYLDANSGKLLEVDEAESSATVKTTVTGTNNNQIEINTEKNLKNYKLYDPERKIEVKQYSSNIGGMYFSNEITSDDNTWNDTIANQAMYNIAKVYDVFNIKFGIKSFFGKINKLTVIVHNTKVPNNASYVNNIIAIGDGDGQTYTSFVNGVDILAHEYTHRYVCKTDKSIFGDHGFQGEIDEAYADIVGNIVENYIREKDTIKPASENENLTFKYDKLWLIGEDITIEEGKGLRNMANPESYSSPDKLSSEYYMYDGDKNKRIHTNNAVLNHAAYLMWNNGNGLTTDEIALIFLDSAKRLSRDASYPNVADMIVELTQEYCPDKKDIVIKAFEETEIYRKQTSTEDNSKQSDENATSFKLGNNTVKYGTYKGNDAAVLGSTLILNSDNTATLDGKKYKFIVEKYNFAQDTSSDSYEDALVFKNDDGSIAFALYYLNGSLRADPMIYVYSGN